MRVGVLTQIPNVIKELKIALPHVNFVDLFNKEIGEDVTFSQPEIIVGDFNMLGPELHKYSKVKWIQGTWAGLDTLLPYLSKPLPFILTRFSGLNFGQMMAEYIIATIVNNERNFYGVYENHKLKDWNRDGKIYNYRVIADLTIGIMGIGTIGSYIGKTLNIFGAKVIGYGRRTCLDKTNDNNSCIAEYFTKASLQAFLKNCDYIINCLPSTKETRGLLNGETLKYCQDKKAVFINVGRGSIIDEEDLIVALNNNWINGAIIDVLETEPVPKENPLWAMKQVLITPHVAGISRAKPIAKCFKENLELYNMGKPIPKTVNLDLEY